MKGSDVQITEHGSMLDYSGEEKWAMMHITTYSKKTVKRELCCPHLPNLLFNYGWFELKTALELRKNESINNIWLNCKFADTEGNPKNEIDIIAELGNRLLFVECNHYSYHLRNFSGTSSTGIFVTNDMPNEKSRSRYEHAMEKCKDNGILTFNFAVWKSNPSACPSLNTIINEQLKYQNKR